MVVKSNLLARSFYRGSYLFSKISLRASHKLTKNYSRSLFPIPGSLNTIGTTVSSGGYRRGLSQTGLEQAIVGAELLRLAGGPGRGWYPKQRHRRPASIEHLDRTAMGHNPWDSTSTRKPQTLPPNLTPKFFQRSPRDALRRVTSLLIKKG